jgi:hypothetical protein
VLHTRQSSSSAVSVTGSVYAGSLAKGDVPVYVLDHRRFDAAMWSRYAHPVGTNPLNEPNLLDAPSSLSKLFGNSATSPLL